MGCKTPTDEILGSGGLASHPIPYIRPACLLHCKTKPQNSSYILFIGTRNQYLEPTGENSISPHEPQVAFHRVPVCQGVVQEIGALRNGLVGGRFQTA
ncbi:hypothetical protein [Pasteuria penetrans]|uniref:hypothetical protein n=1 Tax=Pasteuria penetrans TaxID=86005 RepID=UPI000FA5BA30|nr:hypothetical protein [Pasteuria penetrans]